jgi:hypothetical protein
MQRKRLSFDLARAAFLLQTVLHAGMVVVSCVLISEPRARGPGLSALLLGLGCVSVGWGAKSLWRDRRALNQSPLAYARGRLANGPPEPGLLLGNVANTLAGIALLVGR